MRRRLVLVRHAAPVAPERCHGVASDPGLSVEGRRQAAAVAPRVAALLDDEPARLVTSPAARAGETAAPIARLLGVEPVVVDGWRERDWGDWEGRPWDELWPTVPEGVLDDAASYLAWSPSGAEAAADVAARLDAALADLGSGTTVVVTHAGAIRQAVASLLHLPLTATLRLAVDHARVAVVDQRDDAATLTRLGA